MTAIELVLVLLLAIALVVLAVLLRQSRQRVIDRVNVPLMTVSLLVIVLAGALAVTVLV